jgi:RHS repeat-associated protein
MQKKAKYGMNLSIAHLLYDKPSKDLSEKDYYPFGMLMPQRSFSSENHRFGFNGKENDNEIKDIGNQQNYGLRIYDPRIARFLSIDPLSSSFPWWTPYAFAGNTPIQAIDLDGGEIKKVVHYLDQHPDGTFFVIKTDVDIQRESYVNIQSNGQTYKMAKTTVEYVYQNERYSGETLYESICDGCLKASAGYDYTDEVIEGKMSDDIDYYFNGIDAKWYNRPGRVLDRDIKAPDNAITVDELTDFKDIILSRTLPKKDVVTPTFGNRKGERNQTSKPSGSDNPFKKMKPDPKNDKRVLMKDSNGKEKSLAKPEGFDDYWKNKKK